MAKERFYRLLSCTLVIAALVTNYSCTKKVQNDIVPSSEYAAYVSAYTGGVISQASVIRLELAKDVPVVELNTEIRKSPFTISPSLKGKAYWVSNNVIEFVPEEGALKSGEIYKVNFALGDYVDVPRNLKDFEFTFRVMESNFDVAIDPVKVNSANPALATVTGSITFSDVVPLQQVEKMITVTGAGNKTLAVVVDNSVNPNVFRFAINSIDKQDEEYGIQVAVSGKPLNIDREFKREVIIPASGSFKYLASGKIFDPENGIQLVFSEPVSTTQDLNGLIVIQGVSSPVFQVEDNKVNIFFEPGSSTYINIQVHEGITSESGNKLEESASVSISQEILKPQIEWINNTGTILPDSRNLMINFKAASLYAVDISVVRIFESNILSFLQTNTLSSGGELRRSGRLVYKKMLRLDNDPTRSVSKWESYSVDLSGVIKQEPGAIYRVMLSFKQEYSAYPCEGNDGVKSFSDDALNMTRLDNDTEELDDEVWDIPYTYYYMENEGYDWREYEWEQRDNPCHPSYFMNSERRISCNVLSTNLGIIAKQNSTNKLWVAVSNILDTSPMANIDVTVYNFQLQPIGNALTDADGFAMLECKGGKPFVLVASDGSQKTYLRLAEGEEQSTSRFDVGGKEIPKGLKGFIYGERGVWRPGDTIHVSFILEDVEKRIPARHPVSFELYNPRGQFYTKLISTNGTNGFYTFEVPTNADDPTGLWNAYVKVGGASFHKSFRIETVKPNRLKINLEIPDGMIRTSSGQTDVKLSASWLTGATASNLKAKVEMTLAKVRTRFDNYTQYVFDNPATDFSSSKKDIFDSTLDAEGNTRFVIDVPDATDAPGMLRANIVTRVYEPGGDASINTLSVPFSPYTSYVGINLNQSDTHYIETDTDHVFDVVTVDPDGKPVNRSNLEYKIYRISWSWWWESRNESFASYINNSSYQPVASGKLKTVNGKTDFKFRVDYPSWGRYLVYVKDKDSGHATGGTIYIDWPSWRGRSDKADPSGIKMLTFSLDKESYDVGETVTAFIPAASKGRALVTLENGSTIVKREWIQITEEGDTKYQFTVTPDMAPNVYLHIILLQPHAQTVNDLPIRMYGIVPVFVTNPETVLEPQIKMPDVLRPEKEFSVSVSEKSGKAMTYTLAIVDDGLLDLTNFRTPDPWQEFYAREALGIRTWDMFDDVIGAYAGAYSSLFSIGGDEMLKQDDAKANRFRAVVKFLGPFTIGQGQSNTHKITLPMYVGSVRTMVIAGQDGAYGKVDKTTPVRTPLMVLSTLPRVLSIGEEIWLPVNVFAMEDNVKNVTVSVETSSNLQLTDGSKKSVTFSKTGDQMVYYKLKASTETGIAHVHITASGGGESAKESIEIDIRNPNPVVTLHENKLLGADQTISLPYAVGNSNKENWVKLEVSRIPSVDLSRRFDFLYNYMHACTEQLTSKALPLLFVNQFKDTSAKEQENIRANVQSAIKNLYSRQLTNGGIVYWPGAAVANEWVSSYAGMFLVIAREKGYEVNTGVLNKWKSFQKNAVKNWTPPTKATDWHYSQSAIQQAFRLYTLALAGETELGAMNRMKEVKNLPAQARWRLAAAYALAGKDAAANELVFNVPTTIDRYSSDNFIYGSSDRDEAMILETLVLMGKDREAFAQAQKVSANLNSEYYFSTQSTAYSLLAMGRLADKLSGTLDFEYKIGSKPLTDIKSDRTLYQSDIPTNPLSGSVEIKNKGKGAIYVDLVSRTQLMKDTLQVIASNLRLDVRYTDMAGKALDVTNLKQGTDFMAIVRVSNTNALSNYRDIALTHIIPSGWEVFNERMIVDDSAEKDETVAETRNAVNYDYRDIRDDRVLTYFNLARGQSKEFPIRLQATYAGTYILPAVHCEAMYDTQAQGRTRAGMVTVER